MLYKNPAVTKLVNENSINFQTKDKVIRYAANDKRSQKWI